MSGELSATLEIKDANVAEVLAKANTGVVNYTASIKQAQKATDDLGSKTSTTYTTKIKKTKEAADETEKATNKIKEASRAMTALGGVAGGAFGKLGMASGLSTPMAAVAVAATAAGVAWKIFSAEINASVAGIEAGIDAAQKLKDAIKTNKEKSADAGLKDAAVVQQLEFLGGGKEDLVGKAQKMAEDHGLAGGFKEAAGLITASRSGEGAKLSPAQQENAIQAALFASGSGAVSPAEAMQTIMGNKNLITSLKSGPRAGFRKDEEIGTKVVAMKAAAPGTMAALSGTMSDEQMQQMTFNIGRARSTTIATRSRDVNRYKAAEEEINRVRTVDAVKNAREGFLDTLNPGRANVRSQTKTALDEVDKTGEKYQTIKDQIGWNPLSWGYIPSAVGASMDHTTAQKKADRVIGELQPSREVNGGPEKSSTGFAKGSKNDELLIQTLNRVAAAIENQGAR